MTGRNRTTYLTSRTVARRATMPPTTSTPRDSYPLPNLLLLLLPVLILTIGCSSQIAEEDHHEAESWSVTAWGDLYELFPEIDALVAGEVASSHTHVTRLRDFAPLTEGLVEIVLVGAGREWVFSADKPVRPGIFNVEIQADSPGEYELLFRISTAEGNEEIRGGTVQVGTSEAPGGVLKAPVTKGPRAVGEPVSFLKEEQWRSDFATAWIDEGNLARSVRGFARILPPAGGEASITSPLDAVLLSGNWPFPGREVKKGEALFHLVPRVAAGLSLSALEAQATTLETELAASQSRLSRLEELFSLEATSQREIEDARARVQTLEARKLAADRDLESASFARRGGGAAAVTIRAPFSGKVASVAASPGAAISAGEPLARIVRTDRVWIEVAMPPEGALQLASSGMSGVVLTFPTVPPLPLKAGVRLVSMAPEVDPATGTVVVLLEAPVTDGLLLGMTAEAQVLLTETRPGIVVSATALVDDGGVTVVYLQLSGESFARQEVEILERQGDRVLVGHLAAGQRLVTRGGDAIRRSSLMATGGETQGHVH